MRLLEFSAFLGRGISILFDDSYISRFFVKFVEILAAGFATACSAYVISQLVGPLPATTPTPAAVTVSSAAPAAVEAPKGQPSQPVPPLAAVDQHPPTPRPMTAAPAVPSRPQTAR